MPDTNDLHPASLATLVLIAGIAPTVNAFALAALAVFATLSVHVGVEFLRVAIERSAVVYEK
jgi:hypothetical protein